MKKEKWSEFEKYIVMCDTGKKIKTDSTYSGFLKFLDVKKINLLLFTAVRFTKSQLSKVKHTKLYLIFNRKSIILI